MSASKRGLLAADQRAMVFGRRPRERPGATPNRVDPGYHEPERCPEPVRRNPLRGGGEHAPDQQIDRPGGRQAPVIAGPGVRA